MMIELKLVFALMAAIAVTPAFAAGNHAGGHDVMEIGKPGTKAAIKRTVVISMKEKDDGSMVFEPSVLKVKKGETIRLKFNNMGETDHEFVMDRHEGIQEHKALMQKFPEMEHADPNSIRLAAGGSGEIIWTFAKAGDFGFACLLPGHYESGMKGEITVAP
ncbi:cupredoxin domain-containing protein [Phyllobacterium endophyticum]|nr:plastocyanin/azurin family copper-binding protein [Phyllobacterium endophyticum]MBB3234476.1 putative cupredoxin-like copper-binding protein [Phyllobacterium endophyticum]